MKILEFTPYIYLSNFKKFKRNPTGFGIGLPELFTALSIYNNVYVFTYVYHNKQINSLINKSVNFNLINYSLLELISNFNLNSFPNTYWYISQYVDNEIYPFYLFKFLFKECLIGYLEKIIKKINPDIIQIHGIGLDYIPFIEVAYNSNIPFVLTLHGLNFFDSNIKLYSKKEIEKDIIEFINYQKYHITTVSTGVQKQIIKNFNILNPEFIEVVNDGTDFYNWERNFNKALLRKKFSIDNDKFVIISVGNISSRKNQKFVVDALLKMKRKERNKILYIILGEDTQDMFLSQYIKSIGIEENVKIMGFRDREELIKYYCISDLLVQPSTSEGFGSPFLEAFSCGIPVLTFSDLDAVEDLYSENAMVLISKRNYNDFIKSIFYIMNRKYDQNKIINHGLKFSWNNIAKDYQNVFREAQLKYSQRSKNFKKDFMKFLKERGINSYDNK